MREGAPDALLLARAQASIRIAAFFSQHVRTREACLLIHIVLRRQSTVHFLRRVPLQSITWGLSVLLEDEGARIAGGDRGSRTLLSETADSHPAAAGRLTSSGSSDTDATVTSTSLSELRRPWESAGHCRYCGAAAESAGGLTAETRETLWMMRTAADAMMVIISDVSRVEWNRGARNDAHDL
jgi:signal transduction histidine kinase